MFSDLDSPQKTNWLFYLAVCVLVATPDTEKGVFHDMPPLKYSLNQQPLPLHNLLNTIDLHYMNCGIQGNLGLCYCTSISSHSFFSCFEMPTFIVV